MFQKGDHFSPLQARAAGPSFPQLDRAAGAAETDGDSPTGLGPLLCKVSFLQGCAAGWVVRQGPLQRQFGNRAAGIGLQLRRGCELTAWPVGLETAGAARASEWHS